MKKLFLSLLILVASSSFAQFAEKIVSGRPGRSNGPFGVGKNIYQIQSGINLIGTSFELSDRDYNYSFLDNNTLIRAGITEQIELRAGFDYNLRNKYKIGNSFTEGDDNGFMSFSFGIRKNISSQDGLIPAFGLQLTTKLGGFGDYRQDRNSYELKFLFQHRLNEASIINTNYALEYNHFADNLFSRYVVSYQNSITDKFRFVVEAYGTLDDDNAELLFNGGLGYLVNNDFQVDALLGYDIDKSEGLFPESRTYFISLGVSYRLNKRN